MKVERFLRKSKMGKIKKCYWISIIILICVFRESSAQTARSNRRKVNENNLQRGIGPDHRINQDPNNGLPLLTGRPKRPNQRRRMKSGQQRQDHG